MTTLRRLMPASGRCGRLLRFEHMENRELLSASPSSAPDAAGGGAVLSEQSVIEMTAEEQLVLQQLNRTRLDPDAACDLYGAGLNDGLAPGTITSDPKQPLAPHPALITAAREHSQDMAVRNYFDHVNPEGQEPWDRAWEAGYSGGYIGENIAWGYGCAYVNGGWFNSPGHRQNMMNPEFTEAGIGFAGAYATELLGRGNGHCLTGVVYSDTDGDMQYDVGEGLPGVAVIAAGFTTQTGPSGGWRLNVPDGNYTLTASGGAFGAAATVTATISNANVEVDFLAGRSGALVNFQYVQPGIETDATRFAEGRGLYEAWNGFGVNYRGLNEKYFADTSGTWYAILPSGNVYTAPWGFQDETLVAALDSMYWQDPNKLFDVASPEAHSAYQFAHDRVLQERWTGWGIDHRGLGEKYFYSTAEGAWYAILPGGEVHRSTGGWAFDATSLVVTLTEYYWEDPNRLIYAANPNGLKAYEFTNGQGMWQPWDDWRYNERGYEEKYFQDKHGTVFVILPNGQVHKEASSFGSASFYAALCSDYYYAPILLFVYQ